MSFVSPHYLDLATGKINLFGPGVLHFQLSPVTIVCKQNIILDKFSRILLPVLSGNMYVICIERKSVGGG